ncbi:neutral zinc metallopeptidase [Streptomyces anulatus]|uniref:KPN_02809 family neutral zinc metallopeptidase n=1 Tax=Streptomyces TaxID=1883 RepID=UPI00067CA6BE|nr:MULTISPECIES: neutral zinc metallopeptidase [Streptomyces]KND35438.1 membrane protein [Streptomyces europaeiscabiei]MDF9802925.1 putative metalloprotease [Streptomyces sp. HB372]WTC70280.1 neutral zinc metallopeptidase [Streptomyces anulatus]WUC90104.1 neutral zinc metallopeptidase [Streptomyces anulatus]
MQFDDDADLDTSEVQDVRGSRIPGGKATVGGGIAGVIALILGLLFGVGPDQLGLSSGDADPAATSSSAGQVRENCLKGQDANSREDCRTVAVVNSVQDFWRQEFARRDADYSAAPTVLFSQQVGTACGAATSAVGPFYCPGDRKVYLDLGFFDDLRTKFGSSGGPFAQAYVVAHEYGHHVQNQMGTLSRSQDGRQGENSNAVKVELQADCYAGVWAHHATTTPDESTGRPLITELTRADVRDGLDAAAAVGDDRIQERYQGRVTPESWTHGSAAQRQQWFSTGFRTGDMARCDTFA